MSHDVFISHSSQDNEVANAASRRLEQEGFSCWIAPRDILPGQDYGAAIVEGIRGARLFLLIFSARSNESPQVKREVERAANANLPIIPFRVEDVMPSLALEYFISGSHWLDAIEPPLERHLDYLSEAVARSLGPGLARPVRDPGGGPYDAPRRARRVGRSSVLVAAVGAIALAGAGGVALWTASDDGGGEPATDNAQAAEAVSTIFTRRAVPLPSARQLRLRSAPSQDAPVVRLISPDEVFRVAPRNGDWWPARLTGGDEGFVAHRWIRVIDEEAPGAAEPAARRPGS